MKKILPILIVIAMIQATAGLFHADAAGKLSPNQLPSVSPNVFIENHGQWDEKILYTARGNGYNLIVTSEGISYDYYNVTNQNGKVRRTGNVVKLGLIGSNAAPNIIPGDRKTSSYNYFFGRNKENWITGVKSYETLKLTEVYRGIDLMLKYDKGNPRYDFIVKPGSNPNLINLNFQGAKSIRVSGQELILTTSVGEVKHGKVLAYQDEARKLKIPCNFTANGNVISFDLGSYDKNKPLIIDPTIFSTYIGGDAYDEIINIESLGGGQFLLVGCTESSNFKTTTGAYDETYNMGKDAFISKYNISGTGASLVFSTFFGSDGTDVPGGIGVDNDGNIFTATTTDSKNFPVSSAFNLEYAGGKDVVVTKFNKDCNSIIYSGFYGGSKDDIVNCVAVNKTGNLYISGSTESQNLPYSNAYQKTNAGMRDIFLAKLTPTGSSLMVSTYFGGANDDIPYGMDIDENDNIALTGETSSNGFPIVPLQQGWGGTYNQKPYDMTYAGKGDAFVIKFIGGGGSVDFSTYFGGNAEDRGKAVSMDSDGSVFFAGETQKETGNKTFPTTEFSYQKSHNGGWDCFFAKLSKIISSSGGWGVTNKAQSLIFSGYLGGKSDESVSKMMINKNLSRAILAGTTKSNNFPTTGNEYQKYIGLNDCFVVDLTLDGSSLLNTLLLGGVKDDYLNSMVIDDMNDYIVVGKTASTDLEMLPVSLQKTYGGGTSDGFCMKISRKEITMSYPSGSEALCNGGQITIRWTTASFPEDDYFDIELNRKSTGDIWPIAQQVIGRSYNWTIPNTLPDAQDFVITVFHRSGVIAKTNTFAITNAPKVISLTHQPEKLSFCEGESFSLHVSSTGVKLSYKWRRNGEVIPEAIDSVLLIDSALMKDAGDYDVEVSNTCSPNSISDKITISMIPTTNVTVEPEDYQVIEGKELNVSFTAVGSNLKYQWYKGTSKLLDETKPTLAIAKVIMKDSGNYFCEITGDCGIDSTREFKVNVSKDVGIPELPDIFDGFRISRVYYDKDDIVMQLESISGGDISYEVIDYTGNLIGRGVYNGLFGGLSEIRLKSPGLANGLYWIRIKSGQIFDQEKLIINK